jgi:hypothetical protein
METPVVPLADLILSSEEEAATPRAAEPPTGIVTSLFVPASPLCWITSVPDVPLRMLTCVAGMASSATYDAVAVTVLKIVGEAMRDILTNENDGKKLI